ncbi:MAG: AMP-binding protein [Planctomycetota bacterium]|jgi:acyl-CoA synthetase (AMP-forming)/AMP-acid ligase II
MTFPQAPDSLPGLVERAARAFPDRTLTILDGRGRSSTRYSYAELHERVRTAARHWAGLGLSPGEPVLVSLPTSIEWFDAWLGAAYAGGLPVATAPAGGFGGGDAVLDKIEGLLERLDTRWAVVTHGMQRNLRSKVLTHDDLEAASPGEPGTARAGDPAFLQFTSGSTGWPRAVMIPQEGAIHNPRAIDTAIGTPHGAPTHEWAKTVVSWLPLFHDMGLVGCFLFALYCGHDLVVMPPTVFLARPRIWLQKIADSPEVLAPAPNFGYQYCVERAADESVDLSGWRAAMTGAEMIRPATTGAFADTFGLAPEAFRPCYGLAEGTLAVTFDTRGKGVRTNEDGFVCVGEPVIDTEVRCGDDGSIEARGPGIFSGYYRDEDASTASLRDGWLRTGDLGILEDGELYITGRTKDVLILRGNNVMPHELEWEAEAVTGGGGTARAAAFSVDGGAEGEQAVLVVEAENAGDEIERAIKVRIGRSLGIVLADLKFVRRGRIPRTTSGKVQRGEVKRLYETGELG